MKLKILLKLIFQNRTCKLKVELKYWINNWLLMPAVLALCGWNHLSVIFPSRIHRAIQAIHSKNNRHPSSLALQNVHKITHCAKLSSYLLEVGTLRTLTFGALRTFLATKGQLCAIMSSKQFNHKWYWVRTIVQPALTTHLLQCICRVQPRKALELRTGYCEIIKC